VWTLDTILLPVLTRRRSLHATLAARRLLEELVPTAEVMM
jgi:hypothetical protein